MNKEAFWQVISMYNEQTFGIQIALMLLLALAIVLTYTWKKPYLAKFVLGTLNLFIGTGFFGIYGTEPIQKFFAMPLFTFTGILLAYEAVYHKEDQLHRPKILQGILFALYLAYPLISMLLGNTFPHITTYIMPCPVMCLTIIVYAGYEKKNRLLLLLMTLWGLTGVKSLVFDVYEDLILLTCGIYGVYLLIQEFKIRHK